ncbi:MAG: hypothetical protein ACK4PK_11750 [Alphaproteobacteria bacterium]
MPHLSPFTLPLPEGALPVTLNLALVETMEDSAGSLYALAAALLAGDAAHGDLLRLLDSVYRHAGCTMKDAARSDYLMTLPAARLTTELLAAVLTPLARIDIARETLPVDAAAKDPRPGERAPARAGI